LTIERVMTFQGAPALRGAALVRLRARFPQATFESQTPYEVLAKIESADLGRLSRESGWNVTEVAFLDHGEPTADYAHMRENLGL
jgi:hypothetical protein